MLSLFLLNCIDLTFCSCDKFGCLVVLDFVIFGKDFSCKYMRGDFHAGKENMGAVANPKIFK